MKICQLLNIHIIRNADMALGVPDKGSVSLTGWRYRCIFCGKTIDRLTDAGMLQLMQGTPRELVLQWMQERRSDNLDSRTR